jgi:hypothetical protein
LTGAACLVVWDFKRKDKMKKYKVKITRDSIVEAQNEDEAQDLAFDSLISGDVDFEVEEYEEN